MKSMWPVQSTSWQCVRHIQDEQKNIKTHCRKITKIILHVHCLKDLCPSNGFEAHVHVHLANGFEAHGFELAHGFTVYIVIEEAFHL